MIIEKFEEKYKKDEAFTKLNEKASNLEQLLSTINTDKTSTQIILIRVNELFTIYKQNYTNSEMKKHLLIIEVAIQELLLVLERIINKSS